MWQCRGCCSWGWQVHDGLQVAWGEGRVPDVCEECKGRCWVVLVVLRLVEVSSHLPPLPRAPCDDLNTRNTHTSPSLACMHAQPGGRPAARRRGPHLPLPPPDQPGRTPINRCRERQFRRGRPTDPPTAPPRTFHGFLFGAHTCVHPLQHAARGCTLREPGWHSDVTRARAVSVGRERRVGGRFFGHFRERVGPAPPARRELDPQRRRGLCARGALSDAP